MSQEPGKPRFYLNSYAPLIASPEGRSASELLGIPPFVDGSIRREPDLEHRFPSISCLCRGRMFAPRLAVGDVVAYITVKRAERGRQRLTALLRVKHLLNSHCDASDWYASRRLPLPSNCMVHGNPPLPLEKSHRQNDHLRSGCGGGGLHRWDATYRARAVRWGRFVVCEPLFINLSWKAPVITNEHLNKAFGHVPPTRNPGALPLQGCRRLLRLLGLRDLPSALRISPSAARSRRNTARPVPSGRRGARSARRR